MSLSLIIFLFLFVGGVFLTIFADLSWGIALYELLYFIFPAKRWWYTLPLFRYTFLLSIVIIIVYILKKRSDGNFSCNFFPQEKWLLLMIGAMAIISFYAVWPEEHFRFLRLQIQQFIFMYIAYRSINREKKFNRVVWAFLLGCFYVGYIAKGLPRDSFGRIEGIGMPDGPDANTTAAVLITAVPLLLHYLTIGNKLERIAAFLIFPFVANAVILLNSRGAFLAISLALIYFVAILFRKKMLSSQAKQAVIVFIIVGICLFLYLADATFWARMATIKDVQPGEGTATRTNFWLAGLALVVKHPFGLGARGFEYMSPLILPPEWLTSSGRIAVHSTYVEALVEFGWLGGVIMAGFIISTLRQTKKIKMLATIRNDEKNFIRGLAFEASFLAFLFAAIFIDRLYAEVFYWQMLFIAIFTNIYSSTGPISTKAEC